MLSQHKSFLKAVPVWAEAYRREMNIVLRFDATVMGGNNGAPVLLRLAGSSDYQIFLNGELLGLGPARAGYGYYRIDEYDLTPLLAAGANALSILVAGYNNNGFYLMDLPPFLAAEVVCGDKVLLATLPGEACGFVMRRDLTRLQKVARFSYQRNFSEVYDLRGEHLSAPIPAAVAEETEREYLERGIFYPQYDVERAQAVICRGTATVAEEPPVKLYHDRSLMNICYKTLGFPLEELEFCAPHKAQHLVYAPADKNALPLKGEGSLTLPANGYAVYDMGCNLCGLLGLTVECEGDVTVYAMFDEILTDNDPDQVKFWRLDTTGLVVWQLPRGRHALLSFEPYVFKYLKIAVIGATSVISNVHQRRVGFPAISKKVKTDNPKIQAVYDAAVETFRQNTLDVYMDCPSRERAGWLCDSFFTSRVEHTLTGESQVERNFLENFIFPKSFRHLPDGMLPMCYPADQYSGTFIPNWAMFYVLELEEYLERTGDRAMVDAAKERMYALLRYFRDFENSDGLLEKLKGWIFVEWSKSNDLVQDINFPTNMLYVRMKRTLARLYEDPSLAREADALADVIRKKSFMGDFFCDNMVYGEDGVARLSGECTESCQYYAFFTDIATPETYPALWETLVRDFGPQRKETGLHPKIYFANAFVGNYLRLDLLLRYGYRDELLDNIEGYFYKMAVQTGTLWEHDSTTASCCHGFASHVIVWLDRMGMLE